MTTTVTLSLISHTNAGKTTLARTLLRRDVGEVLDQAHVTVESELHTLIDIDGATLRLWDTPGFGDSARLMRRLRHERDPIGWFLHSVWDRAVDRPMWCSQNAVRNVKEEADAVLYMVNAAEDPEGAGYVVPELELLEWVGRPVLLLLNQVGEDKQDLVERWRRFVSGSPVVRDVLSLDAFTRCWVEESKVLRSTLVLLPDDKAEAMRRLADAWDRRNLDVFRGSCESLARYVARAARDRETPGAGDPAAGSDPVGLRRIAGALQFDVRDRRRAVAALNARLDEATTCLMNELIAGHGLYGASAARVEKRIHDYFVRRRSALDERTGAAIGAMVTGALGGLAADALAGGLTLGGGMIAGAILGALGGTALGRLYRMIDGESEPRVTWSPEFLNELCGEAALLYLAVAHFGRGRGEYRDVIRPESWKPAIDAALDGQRSVLDRAWKATAGGDEHDDVESKLASVFDRVLRDVLTAGYPDAREILR